MADATADEQNSLVCQLCENSVSKSNWTVKGGLIAECAFNLNTSSKKMCKSQCLFFPLKVKSRG